MFLELRKCLMPQWKHHLAQANMSNMRAPLEHPPMAKFAARLEPLNKLAGEPGVRQHRGFENGLHRVFDTAFSEDQNRLRSGNAAENISRVNRFALSLLKQEKTHKPGMKNKRVRAGWEDHFLPKILNR